jgi:hypothetical protein
MRTHLTNGLLAGSLMFAAIGHAQTWENPKVVGNSAFSESYSTCPFAPMQIDFEYGGFDVYAPVAVYRVWQLALGRPPTIHPRSVVLLPQNWDASLWVCHSKIGSTVYNCVSESDNTGFGAPEYATVPATPGYWYIVVTTNTSGQPYWACGNYTLTVNSY